MKESVHHLSFGVLFALVVASIGMSVPSMIQTAAQLPAGRVQRTNARPSPPTVAPRKLAVTPVPAVVNPRARTARLSS